MTDLTTTLPLRIAAARHIPVRFDFRMDVAHGLASRRHTVNVCAVVDSDSGHTGFGECVPRDYVTGESAATVAKVLDGVLGRLPGTVFDSPEALVAFLGDGGSSLDGHRNPAAFCAMELALLDLAGKHWGVSVPGILALDRARDSLTYSLAVPLMPERQLAALLERARPFGFKQVKIKVTSHNPVDVVASVRRILGHGVELRVDVNCSWSRGNAPVFLRSFADLGVVSVEQPFDRDDLEGMASLRKDSPVQIMLDESVTRPEDVERAVALGACDSVNVRLSKCGGMLGALRVTEAAQANGLDIQLGAHVGESSILSAAGAHLASGAGPFRWHEGCYGTYLLESDLCRDDLRWGPAGRVEVPSGPGLGIAVDSELLERASARSEADESRR